MGWAAPSMRHIIRRVRATDTGALLAAISSAICRAAGSNSSGACTLRTSPPVSASPASKMRPENVHSSAWLMPTTRGRNQLEAASGTIPRLANTKPNRAAVLASLMSIGNVIVTPTPTAAPLIAPMTGLVRLEDPQRQHAPAVARHAAARSASVLPTVNVSPPADRSAPAQNARPSPSRSLPAPNRRRRPDRTQ